MKKQLHPLPLAVAAAILLLGSPVGAATYIWNVASPGANNWNVNANWNPSTGNPGSADTVKFGNIGTNTTAAPIINNIVSVNTTITSLAYTNPIGWHVTQIPSAVTLTVTGGATIGGYTNEASAEAVAMVDAGTFYVSGGNYIVSVAANSAVQTITNDLSGLSNFVYNVSAGIFNMCNSNRSQGLLILAAQSNNVTAATANIGTGSTSSTVNTRMMFGSGTNIINVNTINLSAGRGSATLSFFNSFGGLRMRGTGGTDSDRVTMLAENNNTGGTGGGTRTANLSFSGHPVDIKFATLTLGQQTGLNTNCVGAGNLSFDTGTVDATTINMAVSTGSTNTCGANGTINVGANGNLIVGTGGISLVNITPLGTGESATGNLNIGGTATCSGSIVKTTTTVSTGNVTITNGSLTMTAYSAVVGKPAVPIDNLNVTNANLHLRVDGSGAIITNVCASSVNAGGVTTIVIDQVTGVAGPTTFPLVAYSTLNGTVAGNFALTVPGGYIASLVDNAAQNRIDLSISPSVIIVPLVWTGATNSDWDLTTSNWTSAGTVAVYSDPSVTVFDDSASNSTVNLTTALAPISMTMSNSVLNYIFTNAGSIVNTNSLTLKGSATTILDNSGSNSFTGGITIAAGTLQIGNNDAYGNLPDGQSVVDNAALVFKRTDSRTNSSVISGGGTLTQSGSGTLTLAGANSYGATIISAGTLQVGAGGTSGSLGSGAVTDNGTLIFNRSDNMTFATAINGSGSVTKVNNNVLTLSASSGFSSGLTANAGTVRLSNTNAAGTGTITVNPGSTVVLGVANITNNVTLAGGTLATAATQNPLKLELTAAASTTSTLLLADPASLGTGDATEVSFTNTGTWHGSGDVIVATVTNDAAADSGNGFRLRGLAASDFSGTITLSNNVKGELQTSVAGPFSPAGTGKLKLVCGNYLGNNSTSNAVPSNAAYTELNLRNLGSGDTVLGNDVIVLGSGFTTLDPLGTAPAGATVTMGNLTIGNGQELGVYLAAGSNPHIIAFPTVTLTGGTARFSPKTPGFGAVTSVGSDLSFGNISESSPSSIVMNGLRTLFLTGTCTYSGSTTISNGVLALSGSATIANTTNLQIGGGATFDVSGLSSTFTLGAGQTLSGLGTTGTLAGNATLSAGSIALNYTNGTPTLTVTNGTLTLNNNPVTVTVIGTALPAGSYKIISTNTAGMVAGSVASSTLNILGAGVSSGALTTLAILTNELYLVVNHAPTANNVTYARGSVNSWQVPVANLLTNASDVDGDTLTLTSVGTSTNGITLAIGGGYVSYLNANLVDDQFSYTVADGKGGSATGTVTLMITPFVSGQNATIAVTGSTATVGFAGIPGYKYGVQRSTNLVDWATLETTNVPSGGVFDFTDAFSDLGDVPSTAYYRLLWNGN